MSQPLTLLALAGLIVVTAVQSMSLSTLHTGLVVHNQRLNLIDQRKCTMMTVLTPMGRKTICALTFEKPDDAASEGELPPRPTQGRKI